MLIVKRQKFNDELKVILRFIALDSKPNAKSFKNQLISKINALDNMPFKFRQSIYFEDKNIRDLIFKGYVVAYKIEESKARIVILGIIKYQENLLS